MTERYFKYPFADQGDRETIPDDQVNTLVNYQFGYTPEYELNPDTDPDGNYVGRQRFNQVLYDMTAHAKQVQDHGYTLYFADVAYKKGRIVVDSNGDYYRANQDVSGVAPPSPEWDGPLNELQARKATTADVQTGTDDEKYVTPLSLSSIIGGRVGQPFAVFDHLTGSESPSNSGTAKYIKLTAGEDGAGGFNEGLLTNETTTGSGPTVEITAEISTGPMSGQVVHMINSENRHIAPGAVSGVTHNDQMQQITGSFGYLDATGAFGAGAFTEGADASNGHGESSTSTEILFDSANSPNARTGDKTDVKRIEATYYMRIV